MKRKRLNVFSLSFLDIITCGLGAIILLFVLVNAKGAARRDSITADLRAQADRVENQVLEGKKQLIQARNVLEKTLVELEETRGLSRRIIETIQDKKIELADSDKDTLASKSHVNKLKTDLKSLEEDVKRLRAGAKARDELGTKLRPFPGQGDRQYLTDLKMGGRRIKKRWIPQPACWMKLLSVSFAGATWRLKKNYDRPNGGRPWRPSTG